MTAVTSPGRSSGARTAVWRDVDRGCIMSLCILPTEIGRPAVGEAAGAPAHFSRIAFTSAAVSVLPPIDHCPLGTSKLEPT